MERRQASEFPLSSVDVFDSVQRASQRAAALVYFEMKRGVNSLASVAATPPFVGLLGTALICVGIDGTGERYSVLHAQIKTFMQALVPTSFGLFVAIIALWFYKYLSNRLEAFDTEMNNASLELVDQLTMHLARAKQ